MKFYCGDCEAGLLQIPVLCKLAAELQKEVQALKAGSSSPIASPVSSDVIINEVAERQKRSRNVIIFNFSEQNSSDASLRKQGDNVAVVALVKDYIVKTSDIHPIRVH